MLDEHPVHQGMPFDVDKMACIGDFDVAYARRKVVWPHGFAKKAGVHAPISAPVAINVGTSTQVSSIVGVERR